MSGAIILLIVGGFYAGAVQGMDCSLGRSSNVLEEIINSCPQPFQSSDKSFCCIDLANKSTYCCTGDEFAWRTWLEIIVPVIITAAVVISLIVCCVSCLCCSCCPWYRRRHQGTVYGKVQVPNGIQVVRQTPATIQQPTENLYTAYPTNPAGMPQPSHQYTNEMYAKQAPYNPNYVE